MAATAQKKQAPTGAVGRRRKYAVPMTPTTVRLTPAHAEKLARLGGGDWVRNQIDKAKEK